LTRAQRRYEPVLQWDGRSGVEGLRCQLESGVPCSAARPRTPSNGDQQFRSRQYPVTERQWELYRLSVVKENTGIATQGSRYPGHRAQPDFICMLGGKRTAVEVKNLRVHRFAEKVPSPGRRPLLPSAGVSERTKASPVFFRLDKSQETENALLPWGVSIVVSAPSPNVPHPVGVENGVQAQCEGPFEFPAPAGNLPLSVRHNQPRLNIASGREAAHYGNDPK